MRNPRLTSQRVTWPSVYDSLSGKEKPLLGFYNRFPYFLKESAAVGLGLNI